MEGEGIEQAEGILRNTLLYEIAIDVEGKVTVIIPDEGMDKCTLIYQDDGH